MLLGYTYSGPDCLNGLKSVTKKKKTKKFGDGGTPSTAFELPTWGWRPKQVKPKRKAVTNVLEWLQCFGMYVAIASHKEPHRVLDLLAYQHLIIQAHQEYQGDCWLGYNRRFYQRVATNPSMSWSTIDATLWSLPFSGKASSTLCSHCFSTSHLSKDCDLNSDSSPSNRSVTHPPPRSQSLPSQAWRPLCFDWNESSSPGCHCVRNPAMNDKAHKAIFCPNRAFSQGPVGGIRRFGNQWLTNTLYASYHRMKHIQVDYPISSGYTFDKIMCDAPCMYVEICWYICRFSSPGHT